MVAHEPSYCDLMELLFTEFLDLDIEVDAYLSFGKWNIIKETTNKLLEAFHYSDKLAVLSGLSLGWCRGQYVPPSFEFLAISRAKQKSIPFGFMTNWWPQAYHENQWFLPFVTSARTLILPRMTENELIPVRKSCRDARLVIGNHPAYRTAEFVVQTLFTTKF